MDKIFEERTLKLAKDAYKAERYGLAMEYCDKILKENPDSYDTWILKAKVSGWQILEEKSIGNSAVEYTKIALEIVPEEERRNLADEMLRELGHQIESTVNRIFNENAEKAGQLQDTLNICIKCWKDILTIPHVSEGESIAQLGLMKRCFYPSGSSDDAKIRNRVMSKITRDNDGSRMAAEVNDIISKNGLKNDKKYLEENKELAMEELQTSREIMASDKDRLQSNQVRKKELDITIYKCNRDYEEVAKKIFGKGAKLKKELAIKLEELTKELEEIQNDSEKLTEEIKYLNQRVKMLEEVIQ